MNFNSILKWIPSVDKATTLQSLLLKAKPRYHQVIFLNIRYRVFLIYIQPITSFIKSEIGALLPFVGRNELFAEIRRFIEADYNITVGIWAGKICRTAEILKLLYFYGASGIGKTRWLYELANYIKSESEAINKYMSQY